MSRVGQLGQTFARPGRLMAALADLEGECFEQQSLLTFIQTQLPGLLIDQFKLPGHQCEAILQGLQGLFVKVDVFLIEVEQTVNVQGKFGNRLQREGFSPACEFQQSTEHALDGVLVIADQLQVAEAFFGLGQELLGLDKEFGEALYPLFAVHWHAYLHNVMSDEGMPCVATIVNRREIAPRRASAQTERFQRACFH